MRCGTRISERNRVAFAKALFSSAPTAFNFIFFLPADGGGKINGEHVCFLCVPGNNIYIMHFSLFVS